MKYLSIESSTRELSLALSDDDKVIRFCKTDLPKLLESSLIPKIDSLIKKAEWKFKDLDAFAVGLGPGSFTSLRVGLSAVKAFAFASQKPLVGICSLDAIAALVKDTTKPLCVMTDARRQMVYAAVYETVNGEFQRVSKIQLAGVKDVLKLLKGEVQLAGTGAHLYRSDIQSKTTKTFQPIFLNEQHSYAHAKGVARLAFPRLNSGDFDDADRINPLYLYPDNCQVRP